MFSQLMRQLKNAIGIGYRTVRSLITRKCGSAVASVRRFFDFGRKASQIAPEALSNATTAVQKPTKRSDYIETKRLFISKSSLIIGTIALIALGILMYFVIWPFLVSRFFTARMVDTDSRIPDYTGRVIVCYDEELTKPEYAGKLEKGLLQGKGIEYSEDGVVTFEGMFAEGVRSGPGKAYNEDGALAFDGAYESGVRSGSGIEYSASGVKIYEGNFAENQRSGAGTEYAANGVKIYEGSFAEGERSGTGTEYTEDGTLRYEGSFLLGAYNGNGVLYGDAAQVRYKGEFSGGVYEGTGTLYQSQEEWVNGTFSEGVLSGSAKWFVEGKLLYEGDFADEAPDGYGTLYDQRGKAVFSGDFRKGALDGANLISMTTADFREILGESTLTEVTGTAGFTITSAETGITAYCSYRTADAESSVCDVTFAPYGTRFVSMLPDADETKLKQWLGDAKASEGSGSPAYSAAKALQGQSDLNEIRYALTDTERFSAWQSSGLCVAAQWTSMQAGELAPPKEDESSAAAAKALDDFVDKLTSTAATGDAVRLDTSAGTSGKKKPGDLLKAAVKVEKTDEVFAAAMSSFEYAEQQAVYNAQLALRQEELAQVSKAVSQEQTTDTTEQLAATDEMVSLTTGLSNCAVSMKQSEISVSEAVGKTVTDYNLTGLLIAFDPAKLSADTLSKAAEKQAQADFDAKTAEAEDAANTAAEELTQAIEDKETAQSNVTAAQTALSDAAENLAAAQQRLTTAEQQQSEAYAVYQAVLSAVQAEPSADADGDSDAEQTAPRDPDEEEIMSVPEVMQSSTRTSSTTMTLAEAKKAYEDAIAATTAAADTVTTMQSRYTLAQTAYQQATTAREQAVANESIKQAAVDAADAAVLEASVQLVDTAALTTQVKTDLLNLALCWSNLQQYAADYKTMMTTVQTVKQQYLTGAADTATYYDTMCSAQDKGLLLYQQAAAFTRQLYGLNQTTGGWISKHYNWFADQLS